MQFSAKEAAVAAAHEKLEEESKKICLPVNQPHKIFFLSDCASNRHIWDKLLKKIIFLLLTKCSAILTVYSLYAPMINVKKKKCIELHTLSIHTVNIFNFFIFIFSLIMQRTPQKREECWRWRRRIQRNCGKNTR